MTRMGPAGRHVRRGLPLPRRGWKVLQHLEGDGLRYGALAGVVGVEVVARVVCGAHTGGVGRVRQDLGGRQQLASEVERYAGQFLVLHNIGIDSKGNLYTSEVGSGKRAQKFRPAN